MSLGQLCSGLSCHACLLKCPNGTSEIDVVPVPKTYHTSKFAILCLTCFYPTCLDSIVMIEEGV